MKRVCNFFCLKDVILNLAAFFLHKISIGVETEFCSIHCKATSKACCAYVEYSIFHILLPSFYHCLHYSFSSSSSFSITSPVCISTCKVCWNIFVNTLLLILRIFNRHCWSKLTSWFFQGWWLNVFQSFRNCINSIF